MEEFEPKLKTKVFSKEFFSKYAFAFILALLLVTGISYGYMFFVQNKKILTGSITANGLTINYSDPSIRAISLYSPSYDTIGLTEYTKHFTLDNATSNDGIVELTLNESNIVGESSLALTDLRYAVIIDGVIQELADVPSDGKILSMVIPGDETIDVVIKLWPKTSYSGSETIFLGELVPEIKYLGLKAASIDNPAGKYVSFNCNDSSCETWQIVKVEDERLVLTRQADYSGATSRTNSNRYNPNSFNPAISFNDDSLITSLSTDGKNVYLAKTTQVDGGSGTIDDPYTLSNDVFLVDDKKVIAVITYNETGNSSVTQNLYYNETNYISRNPVGYAGWTDGTNQYIYGSVINSTTDIVLSNVSITSTPDPVNSSISVVFNDTMGLFNDYQIDFSLSKLASGDYGDWKSIPACGDVVFTDSDIGTNNIRGELSQCISESSMTFAAAANMYGTVTFSHIVGGVYYLQLYRGPEALSIEPIILAVPNNASISYNLDYIYNDDPITPTPTLTSTPTLTPTPTPTPTFTPTPEPSSTATLIPPAPPSPGATSRPTPEPLMITINGEVIWNDNNNANGNRPYYVSVDLYQGESIYDSRAVTAATGWTYVFEAPDGYNYTVEASNVGGYIKSISGYTITYLGLPSQ